MQFIKCNSGTRNCMQFGAGKEMLNILVQEEVTWQLVVGNTNYNMKMVTRASLIRIWKFSEKFTLTSHSFDLREKRSFQRSNNTHQNPLHKSYNKFISTKYFFSHLNNSFIFCLRFKKKTEKSFYKWPLIAKSRSRIWIQILRGGRA